MPGKIGYNNNIDATKFNVLSNVVVVNPAPTGEQVSLVSTSIKDTLDGANIQKVKLRYLDINWNQKVEIISLDGTTPVLSDATNILRIEAFEAVQTGAGVFGADGTISVVDVDTGLKLFAQIDPTYARFQRALHYVQPGESVVLLDASINCITVGGVVFAIFVANDYTSIGGGIVLEAESVYGLANQSLYIQKNTMSDQVMCDASNSKVALAMGIAVKGVIAAQAGFASFHFITNK